MNDVHMAPHGQWSRTVTIDDVMKRLKQYLVRVDPSRIREMSALVELYKLTTADNRIVSINRVEEMMADLVKYYRVSEDYSPDVSFEPTVGPSGTYWKHPTKNLESQKMGGTASVQYAKNCTTPSFNRRECLCTVCGAELLNPAEKKRHEKYVHMKKLR